MVNTCSDQEKYFKKSRKFRAAKTYDSSTYDSNDDREESDDSIILSLSKPPCKQTNRGISTNKKTQAYKGKNIIRY